MSLSRQTLAVLSALSISASAAEVGPYVGPTSAGTQTPSSQPQVGDPPGAPTRPNSTPPIGVAAIDVFHKFMGIFGVNSQRTGAKEVAQDRNKEALKNEPAGSTARIDVTQTMNDKNWDQGVQSRTSVGQPTVSPPSKSRSEALSEHMTAQSQPQLRQGSPADAGRTLTDRQIDAALKDHAQADKFPSTTTLESTKRADGSISNREVSGKEKGDAAREDIARQANKQFGDLTQKLDPKQPVMTPQAPTPIAPAAPPQAAPAAPPPAAPASASSGPRDFSPGAGRMFERGGVKDWAGSRGSPSGAGKV